MGNSYNSSGDYRIEISGWGLDNRFFVERTELLWAANGDKQVQVHRALPEGAVVFVRLLASEPSTGTVPVAYRVQSIVPMDRNGRCQMRLAQLHPRAQESPAGKVASNASEDPGTVRRMHQFELQLEHEEILP